MAVLGSMLCDDTARRVAVEMLGDEDLYLPRHQLLFDLIRELDTSDPVILRKALADRGLYERIGGKSTIGEILESTPSPARIESYCDIVLRCAARDLLHETGGRTADEVAESLDRAAAEIRAKGAQQDRDPVGVLYAELDDAVAGRRYAAPMPWQRLARDTRALTPGTVTLVCGSPGATKSLLLVQWVRYLIAANVTTCLLALEDGVAYHLRRCAAQILAVSDLTDDRWCKDHPDKVAEIKAKLRPQLDTLRRCIEAPVKAENTPDALIAWVRSKAKNHRVLAIDPITLMAHGARSWEDDKHFMNGSKRIIEESGSSLILVTHPRKLQSGANRAALSMDDLAGGTAWSRFSQTVLYLRAHDDKTATVDHGQGSSEENFNRTMVILKVRNARGGEGSGYAFRFDPESLTLSELGRIRRE
jgi:KaiC/GvpD/RAD55 family RecA-like ATPase